jgi:hypothetical protein
LDNPLKGQRNIEESYIVLLAKAVKLEPSKLANSALSKLRMKMEKNPAKGFDLVSLDEEVGGMGEEGFKFSKPSLQTPFEAYPWISARKGFAIKSNGRRVPFLY